MEAKLLIAPMIISCSLGIGIVDNGIISVRMLIGTAVANGVAATVPSGAGDSMIGTLWDGAHSFTATSADVTGTGPASAPLGVTVVPNITSFSAASGSLITVDGLAAYTQNANRSWSLAAPNDHTLQMSVHSGDHWSTTGWSDLIDDGAAERSEVSFNQLYSQGTQVNVDYQLTVQPGPANTASWLLVNQMHATTEGPPPFGVYMDGEHMEIIWRYKTAGMSTFKELTWRDPNLIQRGHAYDMNVQVNFDPNGNGYLNVWRDGVQIVNYKGAIGMAGASYYWKEGIYRGPAPETF